ncbi:unnamed protein product, partial [Rotaria sordida]
MQIMRKLALTGIAAAEINSMTIHSFLDEQRNSGKVRMIKPGDSKLEKEWANVEYLLIDEMSMVGLTLLAKLNQIICAAKHADPQVSFGGVHVIFFDDYLQYRSVYDVLLHTDFSLPVKKLSDRKTEHLPGLLPLVPRMSVILTQNIAIEWGLINGVNEIFQQLVYQEDSVSTDVISEEFPNNARYVHRSLYALVEINRSKIECNLEQLEPKLIPIPVMEQTFRVDISDIIPKDKKPKSNRKAILSVKRHALP